MEIRHREAWKAAHSSLAAVPIMVQFFEVEIKGLENERDVLGSLGLDFDTDRGHQPPPQVQVRHKRFVLQGVNVYKRLVMHQAVEM